MELAISSVWIPPWRSVWPTTRPSLSRNLFLHQRRLRRCVVCGVGRRAPVRGRSEPGRGVERRRGDSSGSSSKKKIRDDVDGDFDNWDDEGDEFGKQREKDEREWERAFLEDDDDDDEEDDDLEVEDEDEDEDDFREVRKNQGRWRQRGRGEGRNDSSGRQSVGVNKTPLSGRGSRQRSIGREPDYNVDEEDENGRRPSLRNGGRLSREMDLDLDLDEDDDDGDEEDKRKWERAFLADDADEDDDGEEEDESEWERAFLADGDEDESDQDDDDDDDDDEEDEAKWGRAFLRHDGENMNELDDDEDGIEDKTVKNRRNREFQESDDEEEAVRATSGVVEDDEEDDEEDDDEDERKWEQAFLAEEESDEADDENTLDDEEEGGDENYDQLFEESEYDESVDDERRFRGEDPALAMALGQWKRTGTERNREMRRPQRDREREGIRSYRERDEELDEGPQTLEDIAAERLKLGSAEDMRKFGWPLPYEDERLTDGEWEPFKFGHFEVGAFWDFDTMTSDELPLEEVVTKVKKLLTMFGYIKGIWTYGNLMVEERKVKAVIDEKRKMLRRMMWLNEAPRAGKRVKKLYQDGEEEPYDPGFRITDVDPNDFFRDKAWDQVYLTKVKLKCELCNRKDMKKTRQLVQHFMMQHSTEMNQRARQQIDFFRPYEYWWNDEDLVAKYMYALCCIGVREAKLTHIHTNYYVATLGLRFNKVRGQKKEALPQRFKVDMHTHLKRWERKIIGRKKGIIRGPPILVMISDERGRMIRHIREIKARFPAVPLVVVRPKAWKKPYPWADYNFDWDDILNENYAPLEYDEATLKANRWDESELITVRNRKPVIAEVRRKRRRGGRFL